VKKTSLFANVDPLDLKRLLTYAIAYFSVGIGISWLGPLLPFLTENVNVSLGQMGFAFTAQNLGNLLGSVGGGWLYDHVKSHRLMVMALMLMVLMGFLIPLMHWFYGLLIVLFFFGLGLGTIDVGENLSLVRIFKSQVGPYMNALHFIVGIVAFFTPIIVSTMLMWTDGSLSWAVWALVLLFCPGIIGLMTLSSPEYKSIEETEEGASRTGNAGLIVLLMVVIFIAVGVQIAFGGWILTYVSELGIADITTGSLMTSVFWGCVTLGRLIAIPISRKVASGTLVLFNFVLLVLVMALILLWPFNPLMMWIGSAGMGLAISLLFPTLLAFAKTKVNMSGKVTGLFFLGSSLGMMLLPLILGQVFDRFGGFEMMLVLFVSALVGLAGMIVLKRDRFHRQPEGMKV